MNMWFKFVFPVILIIIEIYFFQAVQAIIRDINPIRKFTIQIVYWSISCLSLSLSLIAISLPPPEWPPFFKTYLFSILLILVVSKIFGSIFLLMDDLLRLLRWGTQFFTHFGHPEERKNIERYKFLSYISLGLFTIPFASLFYGIVRGAYRYKIHKVNLSFPNLPEAFDGLKIVQLSDIHTGSFADNSALKKAFEMVLSLKPDLIFFTGDLVNNSSSETEGFLDIYKMLKAPLGVYSILGNHDYGDYIQWPSHEEKVQNLERLKKVHADAGWKLLLNEHAVIEKDKQQFALLGVENWGGNMHFKKYGRMDLAHRGTESYDFKILLSHDPSHWGKQVKKNYQDIDLTFSGHTHGFQFGIEIPNFKWSPVQYIYPQWSGLYKHENQYLYVNRGLGFLGYCGRLGIWPEITCVELKKA